MKIIRLCKFNPAAALSSSVHMGRVRCVTACSRRGSPHHRVWPWALFCFLFNLNEGLRGRRPVVASPCPSSSHARPGLHPSPQVSLWTLRAGEREIPLGTRLGRGPRQLPHAPPAPTTPARVWGIGVYPEAGSRLSAASLPRPTGPGALTPRGAACGPAPTPGSHRGRGAAAAAAAGREPATYLPERRPCVA